MRKVLLVAVMVVLLLATAFMSFRHGAAIQSRAIANELASIQASLWFNHLLTFQEIENNLVAGCTDVALENIRNGIDEEMRLLSGHVKENPSSWAIKYMADRDKDILQKLDSFKSRHGSSWVVPKCIPPSNNSIQPTPPSGRRG